MVIYGILIYYFSGKTGWVPDPVYGVHGNLWSIVDRNDRPLNVITLGSTNQNLRFVDTRVLVDWAYQCLGYE